MIRSYCVHYLININIFKSQKTQGMMKIISISTLTITDHNCTLLFCYRKKCGSLYHCSPHLEAEQVNIILFWPSQQHSMDCSEKCHLEGVMAVNTSSLTENPNQEGNNELSSLDILDVCSLQGEKPVVPRPESETRSPVGVSAEQHQIEIKMCDKQFSGMEKLATHFLGDTGDKTYHCKICNKKVLQEKHINTHFLIHGGEKPYHCKVCENNFTTKRYIKRHLMIHTGEAP